MIDRKLNYILISLNILHAAKEERCFLKLKNRQHFNLHKQVMFYYLMVWNNTPFHISNCDLPIICDVFNSKVLGTVSIGCTEGVEKKSIRRGIPRRQSNFLAFSASFTQCSAHATFHLQVYGVHDLWCKLLLCTTVLVQDTGAGVKNSMVCKKLGDISEMVK